VYARVRKFLVSVSSVSLSLCLSRSSLLSFFALIFFCLSRHSSEQLVVVTLLLLSAGVQLTQTHRVQFHFRRVAFAQQLKSRVGLALAKEEALRILLNLDGVPIISKSHTHPSHSQTSRLLTLSLSLGVPVPRPTQCM